MTFSEEFEDTAVPRDGIGAVALVVVGLFLVSLMGAIVWSAGRSAALAADNVETNSQSVPPSQSQPAVVRPAETAESAGSYRLALPQSHPLDVRLGDAGPQLVAAGAIDLDRFVQLYEGSGRPLTAEQLAILQDGHEGSIEIDFESARFWLNFFWALGLANQNPILTEGPMMQVSEGEIGRFASTGGWTLGRRPATELYASASLVTLTPEQQARLEEVAANVYRPCCNNHTAFADCNHGMAMLGLLELLAGQDATVEEMFAAAKAVNGFWFPQQALETAVFFKATTGRDYADVDPRLATGPNVFSGSGFQQVHQWLATNGLLEQAPAGGGSCGV